MRQDTHTAVSNKPENHEIELKFLTTDSGFKSSQQWAALVEETPRRNAQRLRTRYFDTENADLARHNIALRVRKRGRVHILTLKWTGSFAGGPFERGEIEAISHTAEPDLALLGPEYAGMLAGLIQDRRLIPVYETDIRRTTRRVHSETSEIEAAFDTGYILAAAQKIPVREIELELKSGDPAELFRIGVELATRYPMRLGMLAKSTRGMQLRSGTAPKIVRATSQLAIPAAIGAPSVDEAIGAIINNCIGHFTSNFPAFEAGDAVNAIHQMRVAMRRLRSILNLFHRAFPCPEFEIFRVQAKQIAAAMGAARNWDVFLQLLRDGPAAAFPQETGFETIFLNAEQHREAGYAQVRALLAAPETTCFILSLQGFVARRGWRNVQAPDALLRLTEPAKHFAAAHLNRMHGKLLKKGKNLQELSPHARHSVRVGLKKIRYSADLFGGLFERRTQLRDFERVTAKLQDQLGSYNDLISAIELLAQLDTSARSTNYAAGIIAGWCRHGATPDDEALLRAWKKFQKARLFSA